jgi:hypothetical protein
MKPVYQTVVDMGRGNCMQAAFATLFDKELSEVPDFKILENRYKGEGKTAWLFVMNWLDEIGYEIETWLHPENTLNQDNTYSIQELLKYVPSINGHFYATVRSNKFYKEFGITHAVVINQSGETAHDPNPEYTLNNYHPIITIPVIIKKLNVS